MKYRWIAICVLGFVTLGRAADQFTVPLRGRVQPFKAVAEWQSVRLEHSFGSKENSLLSIGPNDFVSDNGSEIYNLLRQKGIRTLFLMGVHCACSRGLLPSGR